MFRNILCVLPPLVLCRVGGWSQIAEIPADEPLKFKCEDLQNKQQYKFRVSASNRLGPSEPAMLPKTILAKDPWGELPSSS